MGRTGRVGSQGRCTRSCQNLFCRFFDNNKERLNDHITPTAHACMG